MLTRDAILKKGKRRTTCFTVKAWGEDVTVRCVSAGELDHIESLIGAFNRDPMSVTSLMRATVCAYGLSDEAGNRIFSDDDIMALDKLPADGLTEVFNKVVDFNLHSRPDAEKNSETTPSGDSGTS